jgi:type IX secretion system PorP/SprF family membrane protein
MLVMKKLIIAIILITGSSIAIAQQLQHYSQYMINDYVINPAIGGTTGGFDAKLNVRDQWVGVEGAPRTLIFSVNGPLNNRKMGLGGYVYTDVAGYYRRTGSKLSYSYHLKLTSNLNLSFGVSAGILQYTHDFTKGKINAIDDPAASESVASIVLPDAGAGLYLYNDKLFFSISSPQMIPMKTQFFDDYEPSDAKLTNHLYVFGGYKIPVGDALKVEPSVMVKYVNPIPVQINGALRVIFKDMVWVGASYRANDAISFLAGVKLQENILFGYSFDMTTSNIKNHSSGTHEVMLGITFKRRDGSGDNKAKME